MTEKEKNGVSYELPKAQPGNPGVHYENLETQPGNSETSGTRSGKKEKKKIIRQAINCESCVFYDYDEFYDAYLCRQNLDEDEMERFRRGTNAYCPYYKFYDEYKSVQKQN